MRSIVPTNVRLDFLNDDEERHLCVDHLVLKPILLWTDNIVGF